MQDILKWLETDNEYDVYSFDIFDTLLRRRIDPPELVKRLAAGYLSIRLAQLGIHISPDGILAQRGRHEVLLQQQALSLGKDADFHLDDVMEETLKVLKTDSVLDRKDAVNYEIELEKKAAQPMPGAVAVLSYLKSAGKRVICTSDSHLAENQMAAILEHHDLMKYVEKLYVSSEIGKRKSTGRLFKYVRENEEGRLVHIGDNYTSDYLIPKRLGIEALWLHIRSEQKRKSKLAKLRNGRNKMTYVNFVIKSAVQESSELHRIGYEVLGPALTVFVHNVAEQARKDAVETLFFIARDGYALKKIYEILEHGIYAESSLPQARYMCLSRYPVRLASLQSFTQADVSMTAGRFLEKNVSLRSILSSYGLEADDFVATAKHYEVDVDKPIRYSRENRRLQKFLESKEFQDVVRRKSDGARKLFRDYLAGIGVMEKHKVGLVDANVEGLTQYLLERTFVDERNFPILQGYYFDLDSTNLDKLGIDLCSSNMMGIVSDWRRDPRSEWEPLARFGILIELFSHPNHGVTVGYRRVNGRVMPIFRKTPQESLYRLTSQGLKGILCYARDYCSYYGLHSYRCEELLKDARSNVIRWMDSPQRKDAEMLKPLFLTSDWPKESNMVIVNQVKIKDIVTIGGLLNKANSSMYPQGTLALAPWPSVARLIYKTTTYAYRSLKTVSQIFRASHANNTRVR